MKNYELPVKLLSFDLFKSLYGCVFFPQEIVVRVRYGGRLDLETWFKNPDMFVHFIYWRNRIFLITTHCIWSKDHIWVTTCRMIEHVHQSGFEHRMLIHIEN